MWKKKEKKKFQNLRSGSSKHLMSFCFRQYTKRDTEQKREKHDQRNLERRMARDFVQNCGGYDE